MLWHHRQGRAGRMSEGLPRRATLVVNAKSRKGRRLYREACRLLEDAGISLDAAHAVRRPDRLGITVKEAIASGTPMVIVGGGDGSLSGVVDYFVGRGTLFALLPLGTANSFARSLGIPLDLPGAVEVLVEGRRRRIDLGMIGDDYFVNCASIGMAPLIAETVPDALKRILGRTGYLSWAAWKFMQFRPFRLTVRGEGLDETVDAVEVRIANGGYHGGTELVDEAEVDSGCPSSEHSAQLAA